ncbi:MAG TPA: alpha/beta hydrolase [Holophaga sp.]|nr:alpha/beta hydrolase [Holophaga sp.]
MSVKSKASIHPFIPAILLLVVHPSMQAGPRQNLLTQGNAAVQEEFLDGDDAADTPSLPAGVKVLRDLPYGSSRQERMDVYLPAKVTGAPVILMVHGGAWRTGDKDSRNVVENKVARWVQRGFIFISVNYRMLPIADPLEQAEDVAKALAAAQGKAASWGGDPSKFILMGHSAGAHLVSLLTAAPGRAYALGARPWLGTVSLDSAAIDVAAVMNRRHLRLYDSAFGSDPAYWRSVSPIDALSRDALPMFLVCSSTRIDKPSAQAQRFAAKAAAMGVRAEVLEEALSHMQINRSLGQPGDYTIAVERFMGSLDLVVWRTLQARP